MSISNSLPTILVVDDEESFIEALQVGLKREGFRIEVARDGAEALAVFDAVKPGPVAWADRLFKGFGWRGAGGILLDDFVAAFCTLLCFALWRAS